MLFRSDTIPLNRYGTTEEIASAVGFLCSPAASYVNGQTLAVDGGFDASGVGLPTLRLVRWSIGDWSVAGIAPGQFEETVSPR